MLYDTVVVKTKTWGISRCFVEYGKEMHLNASRHRKCSMNIFVFPTNDVIREFKQRRRLRQRKRHSKI